MPTAFGYDPAIIERFPGVVGGIIYAVGLRNVAAPPELATMYRKEQERVATRLLETPIAEIPSIAEWRRTFTACGVKPTQYRVAAEALLRRLHKHGDIPHINPLVDLANLLSIRYALPVAVFDQAGVTGTTTVRFADGDESFTDLAASEPVSPAPGEVIFVDAARLVSARRWCWRQSAQSATTSLTTDALITIEAVHQNGRESIDAAVADGCELLRRFQPDAVVTGTVLTAAEPVVKFGR
ncbi:MAG: B3/B4 domain-containing protein [Acidimicrobiia bacterium]